MILTKFLMLESTLELQRNETIIYNVFTTFGNLKLKLGLTAKVKHWKKKLNAPLYVQIMKNWQNYNGMTEKSIPLSGISMG